MRANDEVINLILLQIMNKKQLKPGNSQMVIYLTEDGEIKLDVRFDGDTVWLTQKLMAELFGTTKQNIGLHLQNIIKEGELSENSVVKDFFTTASDGKNYSTKYYNLDAIIAVGYRVNSKRATQFRIWATKILREFMVKGFVLDDERLKNPDLPFDYFEELAQRIQDIRTSEKRFYRKITDIYALSMDYDPTDQMSIDFFKMVQNKIHWAVTGKTAAEIITERANSTKENMGLTNFRGVKVRKEDVIIAKNYLKKDELLALNNLVEQYLIFAQGQAMKRISMKMIDWIKKLDGFLTINDRKILQTAGKISHELAKEIAKKEYDKFYQKRLQENVKDENDFDRAVKQIESSKSKKK